MMYTIGWVANGDLRFADTDRLEDAKVLFHILEEHGYKVNYWPQGEPEETVAALYQANAFRD